MKILKIVLVILLPALGIVSCQKSGLKPRGCSEHSTEQKESNSISDDKSSGDRIIMGEAIEEGQSTDVIGSGDDDRDGGDKKTKKSSVK